MSSPRERIVTRSISNQKNTTLTREKIVTRSMSKRNNTTPVHKKIVTHSISKRKNTTSVIASKLSKAPKAYSNSSSTKTVEPPENKQPKEAKLPPINRLPSAVKLKNNIDHISLPKSNSFSKDNKPNAILVFDVDDTLITGDTKQLTFIQETKLKNLLNYAITHHIMLAISTARTYSIEQEMMNHPISVTNLITQLDNYFSHVYFTNDNSVLKAHTLEHLYELYNIEPEKISLIDDNPLSLAPLQKKLMSAGNFRQYNPKRLGFHPIEVKENNSTHLEEAEHFCQKHIPKAATSLKMA